MIYKENISCSSKSGTVSKVTDETIAVNIMNVSACSTCRVGAACSAFDRKEKIVLVPNIGQGVETGDTVTVSIRKNAGAKAVLLAYVLPLILVVVVLLSLSGAGAGELAAGMGALASLALYYSALYLSGNKLKNQFTFHLEKTIID
ncbi:MAG: SoxR reducing system RseC family protein [Prevotellaceae bacterium]|jgi:sigma-E factor negative regulatory protein RseC|nr:SoxR reducing system RseC family protein [Prevotellaceae bacterium]